MGAGQVTHLSLAMSTLARHGLKEARQTKTSWYGGPSSHAAFVQEFTQY